MLAVQAQRRSLREREAEVAAAAVRMPPLHRCVVVACSRHHLARCPRAGADADHRARARARQTGAPVVSLAELPHKAAACTQGPRLPSRVLCCRSTRLLSPLCAAMPRPNSRGCERRARSRSRALQTLRNTRGIVFTRTAVGHFTTSQKQILRG